MKAPEKIYMTPSFGEPDNVLLATFSESHLNFHLDIEYTRTDAFIEKACDAYCAICDTKECDGCAECSWVIKFRRQLLKY